MRSEGSTNSDFCGGGRTSVTGELGSRRRGACWKRALPGRVRRYVTLACVTATVWASLAARIPARPDAAELAHQPLSEYQARRKRLMDTIRDGIVVVIGAREDEFGEVGRFRQKNDFMYLTGCETPAAFLMLVPPGLVTENPGQETLFIPPRDLSQEKWTGPQIGPGAEAERMFGIREVASTNEFYPRLVTLLMGPPFKPESSRALPAAKLYTIIPEGSAASLTRESQFVDLVHRLAPDLEVADVSAILGEMRKAKSPAEIRVLQKAIDISADAQRAAAAAVRPGAWEYEVQAAVEDVFTRNGSERPGYPSIIGSGINSTVLHYNQNHKQIEPGDLVVCDVGAEYSYYTADTTRTYPASGKFTARQRDVYMLVLEAQRAAEKAFKPGQVTIHQLYEVAVNVMKSSSLRDEQGNTLDRYFIHGLGHWLGMDVHDAGSYSTPIPAGAVFTIEPGIYIPQEKLGVRIEDNYLATPAGLVKLTEKIPSQPAEVERMMSETRGASR